MQEDSLNLGFPLVEVEMTIVVLNDEVWRNRDIKGIITNIATCFVFGRNSYLG